VRGLRSEVRAPAGRRRPAWRPRYILSGGVALFTAAGLNPMLAWRWDIELPIRSPLDERTREGDDHPARLFLRFATDRGEKRALEVIWGNRLKPGEYKYIGNFPHFVADAGDDRVGRSWRLGRSPHRIACPTSNDGKARPHRLEAKLIRRQELSRVRAKRAHSRRRANLAMSMTTLEWEPAPISLAPSVARTANSICRPSTFVTSASAVTRRPTGVAAR